jgi:hypothetical protein
VLGNEVHTLVLDQDHATFVDERFDKHGP